MLDKSLSDAVEWLREELEKRQQLKGRKSDFSITELKQYFVPKYTDEIFLQFTLKKGVNKGVFFQKDQHYYLEDPAKDEAENKLVHDISELYKKYRFAAPTLAEAAEGLNTDLPVLKRLTGKLVQDGILISIDGKFYLHRDTFDELLTYLKGYFKNKSEISVSQLREFSGVTRKYLIPLLEYLDRQDYTRREGDVRKKGDLF